MGCVEIPLTRGHVALVDEVDIKLVSGINWYSHVMPHTIYAKSTGKDRTYMHRLIMSPPPGRKVDHINGNGLDNRRCNLRLASSKMNAVNRSANINKSDVRFKGVTRNKVGNFQAHIKNDGARIYLGTFRNEIDAALAYDRKALELWGDFAKTNLPRRIIELTDFDKLMVVKLGDWRKL